MHKLDAMTISPAFRPCWQSAREHIERQADGAVPSWYRSGPHVVRVIDADGQVEAPGTLDGMRLAARGLRGHACLMPMRRHPGDGSWVPASPGWGLLSSRTGRPIDPVALVTDVPVEIGDWELQHFAAHAVVHTLERHGMLVGSWQFNPQVHPTIWFTRPGVGPEWIVVRAARHPREPRRLRTWKALWETLSEQSGRGHFLPVMVSADIPTEQAKVQEMKAVEGPLLRGHRLRAFVSMKGSPPWASDTRLGATSTEST